MAASDTAVWVEAHRANILTVIDPEKNAEIEQLEDVPVHCSLRAAGDAVWATEFSGGTVTRVDAVTHDVVGTVELDDACGLAVRDDDPRVTSPGMGKVVRYDTATLSFRRGRAGTGPRRRAVAAC